MAPRTRPSRTPTRGPSTRPARTPTRSPSIIRRPTRSVTDPRSIPTTSRGNRADLVRILKSSAGLHIDPSVRTRILTAMGTKARLALLSAMATRSKTA